MQGLNYNGKIIEKNGLFWYYGDIKIESWSIMNPLNLKINIDIKSVLFLYSEFKR